MAGGAELQKEGEAGRQSCARAQAVLGVGSVKERVRGSRRRGSLQDAEGSILWERAPAGAMRDAGGGGGGGDGSGGGAVLLGGERVEMEGGGWNASDQEWSGSDATSSGSSSMSISPRLLAEYAPRKPRTWTSACGEDGQERRRKGGMGGKGEREGLRAMDVMGGVPQGSVDANLPPLSAQVRTPPGKVGLGGGEEEDTLARTTTTSTLLSTRNTPSLTPPNFPSHTPLATIAFPTSSWSVVPHWGLRSASGSPGSQMSITPGSQMSITPNVLNPSHSPATPRRHVQPCPPNPTPVSLLPGGHTVSRREAGPGRDRERERERDQWSGSRGLNSKSTALPAHRWHGAEESDVSGMSLVSHVATRHVGDLSHVTTRDLSHVATPAQSPVPPTETSPTSGDQVGTAVWEGRGAGVGGAEGGTRHAETAELEARLAALERTWQAAVGEHDQGIGFGVGGRSVTCMSEAARSLSEAAPSSASTYSIAHMAGSALLSTPQLAVACKV
jgi:hypothetical protein